MKCLNVGYREVLRTGADELAAAIDVFTEGPTSANLAQVNSLWAKCWRILENVPPEKDPNAPLAPAVDEKIRIAA